MSVRQGSGEREAGGMRRVGLAILSAILLIISFPPFNFWPAAFVALIPLFFALEGTKPLTAFLLSFLAGALFFLGTIWWLIHVTLPGMLLFVLYLAMYVGLFGVITSYELRVTAGGRAADGVRGTGYVSLFVIPAIWILTEWVRSNGTLGFGWNLLAYSQSYNLPIIQIADMTGPYGVSFLIVMVNAAIYATAREAKNGRGLSLHLAVALALVFVSLAYGTYRLKNIFTGDAIRVAVVQGGIPQEEKWDAAHREEILLKYETLTRQACADAPGVKNDLVIWPETSVPGFLETDPRLSKRIRALASSIGTPLLVGTPRGVSVGGEERYYNSAVLFAGDGRVLGRYDKLHLVPFGEYVPFKNVFSFVERVTSSPIGDFTAGTDRTVLAFLIERELKDTVTTWRKLRKVRFSCLICFEDIFPEIARAFAARGADLLVNITNDAWFRDSPAAYQHAQASVFRAVENRLNVVRAANTGYSCVIDPRGRIIGAVERNGRNLFVDGAASAQIVLTRAKTFYTSRGDLIVGLALCLILTRYAAYAIVSRSKKNGGGSQ